MDSGGLLDHREEGDDISSDLGRINGGETRLTEPNDDDDDDVIAEATLCGICTPIFRENSYER